MLCICRSGPDSACAAGVLTWSPYHMSLMPTSRCLRQSTASCCSTAAWCSRSLVTRHIWTHLTAQILWQWRNKSDGRLQRQGAQHRSALGHHCSCRALQPKKQSLMACFAFCLRCGVPCSDNCASLQSLSSSCGCHFHCPLLSPRLRTPSVIFARCHACDVCACERCLQDVDSFLTQQPVNALPGVGWACSSKLEALGIRTVAELHVFDKARLAEDVGAKTAEELRRFAWGIDDRVVHFPDMTPQIAVDCSDLHKIACTTHFIAVCSPFICLCLSTRRRRSWHVNLAVVCRWRCQGLARAWVLK